MSMVKYKGMVVLDDILEEIVGQFTSSQGESINEINLQDDGSYLVDPRISIREINCSTQGKTYHLIMPRHLMD